MSKMTHPTREKLHVIRARLWENVYASYARTWSDGNKIACSSPEILADGAVAAFDKRFSPVKVAENEVPTKVEQPDPIETIIEDTHPINPITHEP